MDARGIAAGLALVMLAPAAGAAPTQVHVSQLPEGLVVQWAREGDTRGEPPGEVLHGASTAYGLAAAAQMVGYVDGSPYVGFSSVGIQRDLVEAPATLYRANLGAFPPGTLVHYRVVDGGNATSAPYSVRTLPGPDEPLRFVAYGDQGTTEDGTLGAPHYRPGDVTQLAVGLDPQLAIVAGDTAYAEEAALRFWNQWFEIVQPLAATRPFYAAVGNHDRDFVTGYDHWTKRFAFPGDEQNYAFDAGPVHFLVLNSQEACLEGASTELVQRVNPNCTVATQTGAPTENVAITSFMRADLGDASARGVPWIVAVFHHPPYAHGGYNETNAGTSYMWWMREHWVPILEEHGVDLVITAHDHSYQRTWPLRDDEPQAGGATYAEGSGIVYVVTGGGGRRPYTLSEGTPRWLASAASAHHVTLVDATATTLRVEALDLTGSTIDAFEVHKDAPALHAGPLWLALAAAAALLGRALRRRPTQG